MGMCGDAVKPANKNKNAENGQGSPGKEQSQVNNTNMKDTNGASTNVSKTTNPNNVSMPKGRSFDDLPLELPMDSGIRGVKAR